MPRPPTSPPPPRRSRRHGPREILPALPLTQDNFGLFAADAGEIRLVWSAPGPGHNLAQGAAVFRIHYEVLQTGGQLSDFFQLNDSIMPGLAYTAAFEESPVLLDFISVTATGAPADMQEMYLFQNRPNPFSGTTNIGFRLPGACEAQLRVLDVQGREIWRSSKHYPAGTHEEVIFLENTSGVLYYELVTPFGLLTRKMVVGR